MISLFALSPKLLVAVLATLFSLQTPDWSSPMAVLAWLAGTGAPFVAGYLLSLLAENWPKWHALDGRIKFVTPMVVSVVISVIATYLGKNDAFVTAITPAWAIIAGAILTWIGSQQAYMTATRSGYAYKAKISSGAYATDTEQPEDNWPEIEAGHEPPQG